MDRARDGDALALAAGERADRLLRVAHVDADPPHVLVHDAVRLLHVHERENGPSLFLTGSRPMKKLRVTDSSGIIARS